MKCQPMVDTRMLRYIVRVTPQDTIMSGSCCTVHSFETIMNHLDHDGAFQSFDTIVIAGNQPVGNQSFMLQLIHCSRDKTVIP